MELQEWVLTVDELKKALDNCPPDMVVWVGLGDYAKPLAHLLVSSFEDEDGNEYENVLLLYDEY